jgi:hypothetical protein
MGSHGVVGSKDDTIPRCCGPKGAARSKLYAYRDMATAQMKEKR